MKICNVEDMPGFKYNTHNCSFCVYFVYDDWYTREMISEGMENEKRGLCRHPMLKGAGVVECDVCPEKDGCDELEEEGEACEVCEACCNRLVSDRYVCNEYRAYECDCPYCGNCEYDNCECDQ